MSVHVKKAGNNNSNNDDNNNNNNNNKRKTKIIKEKCRIISRKKMTKWRKKKTCGIWKTKSN